MNKVNCIQFNWFVNSEGQHYEERNVGQQGVKHIGLSGTQYGSRRFWIITFENGAEECIYNPNRVYSDAAPANINPLDDLPY